MLEDDIECPECEAYTKTRLEYEDAGEGSEHNHKCEHCNHVFKFEVSYSHSFTTID